MRKSCKRQFEAEEEEVFLARRFNSIFFYMNKRLAKGYKNLGGKNPALSTFLKNHVEKEFQNGNTFYFRLKELSERYIDDIRGHRKKKAYY